MIFRTPKSRFTAISRELAQDTSLSFAARGMMLYLLSKSDNWSAQLKDLMRAGDCGMKAIRALLQELESAGYMRRICQHNGKQLEWITEVYEEPVNTEERTISKGRTKKKQSSPLVNSAPVNSAPVNSANGHSYMNKEVPNTDLQYKEKPYSLSPRSALRESKPPAAGGRGSRFSLDDCRKYARSLSGINSIEGFAKTIWRSGEDDQLIETFIKTGPVKKETDKERYARIAREMEERDERERQSKSKTSADGNHPNHTAHGGS